MRLKFLPIFISSAVFLSSAAAAATVDGISGTVMVNNGSGYRTVADRTPLKVGDTVIVSPGSAARIQYSDGCAVPVEPGVVATVLAKSPCASETAQSPGAQVAIGAAVAAAGVGVAIGIANISSDSKPKPISP